MNYLCSLQTYIMYLIKYLAITIYFLVMSNKLLPYHNIPCNIFQMDSATMQYLIYSNV